MTMRRSQAPRRSTYEIPSAEGQRIPLRGAADSDDAKRQMLELARGALATAFPPHEQHGNGTTPPSGTQTQEDAMDAEHTEALDQAAQNHERDDETARLRELVVYMHGRVKAGGPRNYEDFIPDHLADTHRRALDEADQ